LLATMTPDIVFDDAMLRCVTEGLMSRFSSHLQPQFRAGEPAKTPREAT
jgi:hypothetical protein